MNTPALHHVGITSAIAAAALGVALTGAVRAQDAVAQHPEKIAWFSTLDSGLAEARRTQRPILMLAARPECRGVPGFW